MDRVNYYNIFKLLILFSLFAYVIYAFVNRSRENFTLQDIVSTWDQSLIHYIGYENGNIITDAIYNFFYDMHSKNKKCKDMFKDYKKMLNSVYGAPWGNYTNAGPNVKINGIPYKDVLYEEKSYTYFCTLFENAFKKGIGNIQKNPLREYIFLKVLKSGVPSSVGNMYFNVVDNTTSYNPNNIIKYPHADAIYNLFFEFTKRKGMCPTYNNYAEAINNVDKNLFVANVVSKKGVSLSVDEGYAVVKNYFLDRDTYNNYCRMTKISDMGTLSYNRLTDDINNVLMKAIK